MLYYLRVTSVVAILVLASLSAACGDERGFSSARETTMAVRPFVTVGGDRWIGNAICYGPHRDGQHPGGPAPSAAEVRADLHLMLHHWSLLRLYGSVEVAETVLSVIRSDSLEMKVMLGAWIAVEQERDEHGKVTAAYPDAAGANQREVDAAIRLARAYPEIVVAVCVGNETQVSWSAHPSPLDILIGHLRRVRTGVSVPVTTADDFQYWLTPDSRALAREIDFITLHAHPMWNGQSLEQALPWLKDQVDAVRSVHPTASLVLGETGWATSVATVGEQTTLIKGRPGEAEQRAFYRDVCAWTEAARLSCFFFEAFDENWKGGSDPAEVEKHWGLFRADRSPKLAIGGR